jgi:predicted DNA-binding ribbon-helix-helix protein
MKDGLFPPLFLAAVAENVPKKRSVHLYGHRTSVTLEPFFWRQLNEISAQKKISVQKIIEAIDHFQPNNLSSALRLFVLIESMQQHPEK